MTRNSFSSYPAVYALLLAVWVFLLLFSLGCGQEQEAPRQFQPQVTVAPPLQQTVPLYQEFVGNLKAVEEVEIRARVEGYLIKRAFQDGADVKRGDLLFVLDLREYEAELERAQAHLAKDRAALAYARTQVGRYSPLIKQDLAPEDTLENWRTAVKERAGAVKAGEAAVKLAQLNLSYCTIRAPLSGRIGRRLVDVGNLVGANEETLLATIVQMDPIYVYFSPSERQLPQISRKNREGRLQVRVTQPGGSNYPHAGKLDFIDNRVDPATGTITMRAVIPNPEKILVPGQYVNVRLLLGEQPQALLVPERAVGTDQQGSYVFVLGPEDVVQQRYVQIGPTYPDNLLLIEKGLKQGEQVVVEGLLRLRPGIKVTPTPASSSKKNPKAPSGQ
jgi:RND family efflux transporter MFP subunit